MLLIEHAGQRMDQITLPISRPCPPSWRAIWKSTHSSDTESLLMSILRKINFNLEIVRGAQALIFWHSSLLFIAISCCFLNFPLVGQASIWVLVDKCQTAATTTTATMIVAPAPNCNFTPIRTSIAYAPLEIAAASQLQTTVKRSTKGNRCLYHTFIVKMIQNSCWAVLPVSCSTCNCCTDFISTHGAHD
jgi:hypothetical protein